MNSNSPSCRMWRKAARGLDLDLDNLHRSFVARTGPKVRDATSYYADRINVALNDISARQLPSRQAVIETADSCVGGRSWADQFVDY